MRFAVPALLSTLILFGIAHPIGHDANALDAYSSQEQQQFLDWCTGEKGATQSVCSCALKSVAQTVPAAALTSYIGSQASGSGFSVSSLAATAGTSAAVSVTQALATCSR